jgi:DNA-binding transcriptional ArsR family regulator
VLKSRRDRSADLAKVIDITDPMVVKAYSHPLRIEILGLLDNRVASPRQLATELGTGLSTTSYHVRQLAALKLIRLVRRRQVRGAIEHYYTANVRPTLSDSAWAQMPRVAQRAWLGNKIAQIGEEVVAAAETGGFDRDDMHLTRTAIRISADQWTAIAKILTRALEEIDDLTEAPPSSDSDEDQRNAVVVMMLFESALPEAFGADLAVSADHDDHADISAPQSRE